MRVKLKKRGHEHARVKRTYKMLLRQYGHQNWWPARSPFEVMVGAILTQNTNWANVERAILNLRRSRMLTARSLARGNRKIIENLIRSCGYYRQKTRRIKLFASWLRGSYDGSVSIMARKSLQTMRAELLALNGVGEETADSILLYALRKPSFVIDTYTRRFLATQDIQKRTYREYQDYMSMPFAHLRTSEQVKIFSEYHALIVQWGKEHSRDVVRAANK